MQRLRQWFKYAWSSGRVPDSGLACWYGERAASDRRWGRQFAAHEDGRSAPREEVCCRSGGSGTLLVLGLDAVDLPPRRSSQQATQRFSMRRPAGIMKRMHSKGIQASGRHGTAKMVHIPSRRKAEFCRLRMPSLLLLSCRQISRAQDKSRAAPAGGCLRFHVRILDFAKAPNGHTSL